MTPPVRRVRAFAFAATGLIALAGVEALQDMTPWILAASMLAGLPHGAADHDLAERWLDGHTLRERIAFHLGYLAAVAIVMAAWFLAPSAAVWTFLLFTAWHFGQSDLLHLPEPLQHSAVAATRGGLLLGGLLFTSPEIIWELVHVTAGNDRQPLPLPSESSLTAFWMLAGLHIGAVLLYGRSVPEAMKNTVLDASAIVVAWSLVGGALGLALYFAFWHTPDHFAAIRSGRDWREMLKLTAPRTIGAAAGLVLLGVLVPTSSWPLVIVMLIAALTVPHAMVVHLTLPRRANA